MNGIQLLRKEDMRIQAIIDDFLRSHRFRSVTDLEYYEPDEVILIRRKMGFKDSMIDVSSDKDEESLIRHLESVPAIY